MTSGQHQGGTFGGVDDLYRDVILDHFKKPHNKGAVEQSNAKSEGLNPLCGDQIYLTAWIENGEIKKLSFDGHGCAISQASASMLTSLLTGQTILEARSKSNLVKQMLGVDQTKLPLNEMDLDKLGDMAALEGVKKYPVRIKCALLAWNTLLNLLEKYET